MFFVEDRIIKDDVASGIESDVVAKGLPDLAGRKATNFEEVLHIVMCDTIEVISQIGGGVINLTAQQKLSIQVCSDFQAIFDSIYHFCVSPKLITYSQ